MNWTERHTEGINKIYAALLDALKDAPTAEDCRETLDGMAWPYGNEGTFKDVSQRVKATLANQAIVESRRLRL